WIWTGCSLFPRLTLVMVNVRGPDSRSTASSWSLVGAMVSLMSISDHHIHVVGAPLGHRESSDGGLVAGDHLGRGALERLDGREAGLMPARVRPEARDPDGHGAAVGDVVAPLAAAHQKAVLDLGDVLGGHLAGEDCRHMLFRPAGFALD